MDKYNFYYDESEHSRKINYPTVSASNYYDNFVTAIVGWPESLDSEIVEKYTAFELKYEDRKDKYGEIKSTIFKQKHFKYGFASQNKYNAKFLNDFLSLFTPDLHLYFSVASKIEYIILQLFANYNAKSMKYSVVKALIVYHPKEVIECLCETPENFISVLKDFFRDRIKANQENPLLKRNESAAFYEILCYLNTISFIPEQRWDYHMAFDGFRKYLKEEKIDDYFLLLDHEGELNEDSKTLQAARDIGFNAIGEADSKTSCGLRMADMIAGILAKLLKALCDSLRYNSISDGVKKKTLDPHWFQLKDFQLDLYKKLYQIICVWDNAWYKSYAGIYSDDLVSLISLLEYMNHFESVDQIYKEGIDNHPENFNAFSCDQLSDYFNRSGLQFS